MVVKRVALKVIKDPLPYEKVIIKPDFPRFPRLYLELLENTQKIKKELVGVDHIPTKELEKGRDRRDRRRTPDRKDRKDDRKRTPEKRDRKDDRKRTPDRKDRKDSRKDDRKRTPDRKDRKDSRKDDRKRTPDRKDRKRTPDKPSPGEDPLLDIDFNDIDPGDIDLGDVEQYLQDYPDAGNEEPPQEHDRSPRGKRRTESPRGKRRTESPRGKRRTESPRNRDRSPKGKKDQDDTFDLDALLKASSRSARKQLRSKAGSRDSRERRSRERGSSQKYFGRRRTPPTLAEIRNNAPLVDRHGFRDYSRVTPQEQDVENRKRDLIFRFKLLENEYKDRKEEIPTYTMHTDLMTMERAYESTVRGLALDANVAKYKKWLLYGFGGTEVLLGHVLKFDVKGYTKEQIKNLKSYEHLLIELGEKTYVPKASKWPVEVRLVGTIIINAAFFIVGRMITKMAGVDILGALSSFMGVTETLGPTPLPKKKMKPPTINLDDIPDIDDIPVPEDAGYDEKYAAAKEAEETAQMETPSPPKEPPLKRAKKASSQGEASPKRAHKKDTRASPKRAPKKSPSMMDMADIPVNLDGTAEPEIEFLKK